MADTLRGAAVSRTHAGRVSLCAPRSVRGYPLPGSPAEGRENVAQHRLAVALGEDGPDLREALEGYDAATCGEMGRSVDAIIYARALLCARGWRARP